MISDQDGLNKAYNTEDGLFEDRETNTLFIAGTRNMSDVGEWWKIPAFRTKDSAIYGRAKKYLDEHPYISNLVGHSFGGSAALQFQKDDKKYKTRTYGAPVFDPIPRNPFYRPQRYCNKYDPVCAADMAAEKQQRLISLSTHSYYNTSKHYGEKQRVIQPTHRKRMARRRLHTLAPWMYPA